MKGPTARQANADAAKAKGAANVTAKAPPGGSKAKPQAARASSHSTTLPKGMRRGGA